MITLATLPYDLLLNIARHLELSDIYNLQLSCRSLHAFAVTRPVYRNLASLLLRRCRALPLHGFQRFTDLTDQQLIDAVNQAARLEAAWLTRGPRPASAMPFDGPPDEFGLPTRTWYKIISAPPDEEVDWLSPITSSYSLCATKSGKVVCWDVHRDICLAEWNPKERWELWKCRVEFDVRTVFFTMAKIISRQLDDRLMEFVLMKLHFPESGEPQFVELATFKTVGVVMNVFLLDPSSRLLAAFVWVSSSNTIGLYTLLDWDIEEYVFIDTGIDCSISSNWSCILYKEQIVIHCEESDVAHQYFYPLSLLQRYVRPSTRATGFIPRISERVSPMARMTAAFVFPPRSQSQSRQQSREPPNGPYQETYSSDDEVEDREDGDGEQDGGDDGDDAGDDAGEGDDEPDPNPFPYPPWYPESAHFVRQWWPTLSSVPKLSCTVLLLADHEPETHRTRYVLAQHYFKVPLVEPEEVENAPEEAAKAVAEAFATDANTNGHALANGYANGPPLPRGAESSMMRLWYVSEAFEVVCVLDEVDEDIDPEGAQERPRPLMAVDFGHAVWIEFAFPLDVSRDEKRLRFVTFPPVGADRHAMARGRDGGGHGGGATSGTLEGVVRTLEVPPELNLDTVETINIDQSQGAIIVSVRDGKIFILCYD
ncbi:uncharacterized protein BXZ73DRAFT_89497 [Epithele typhae]|uniref:uncharacterized protein n=1 Tax=Epithele typhae TaxID=378194 RepID=UPI002007B08A|nr:uncharacterized protein BXZ73DRAFT_89497 [Epithele typhae]KAH9935112.1 hypothetical protein BXZ73DRAFT_89497 [Epithele typhae]